MLRFRPSIWSSNLECYIAELYVRPVAPPSGARPRADGRGAGGRRAKGADYIDLGTSEDDVAARALYESLGFRNRESGPTGR